MAEDCLLRGLKIQKEMNGKRGTPNFKHGSHYTVGSYARPAIQKYHLGLWHNNINHTKIFLQAMSNKSATLVNLQKQVVPVTL